MYLGKTARWAAIAVGLLALLGSQPAVAHEPAVQQFSGFKLTLRFDPPQGGPLIEQTYPAGQKIYARADFNPGWMSAAPNRHGGALLDGNPIDGSYEGFSAGQEIRMDTDHDLVFAALRVPDQPQFHGRLTVATDPPGAGSTEGSSDFLLSNTVTGVVHVNPRMVFDHFALDNTGVCLDAKPDPRGRIACTVRPTGQAMLIAYFARYYDDSGKK
ncbi:hypothetical protein [Nocardia alni]|uniref:hypothetical protein n=1 Tax=Nocardia alni TaxID=2815723 RepID=UPI001C21D3C3|nr:hypothetical protein [Nocardia alni]